MSKKLAAVLHDNETSRKVELIVPESKPETTEVTRSIIFAGSRTTSKLEFERIGEGVREKWREIVSG